MDQRRRSGFCCLRGLELFLFIFMDILTHFDCMLRVSITAAVKPNQLQADRGFDARKKEMFKSLYLHIFMTQRLMTDRAGFISQGHTEVGLK